MSRSQNPKWVEIKHLSPQIGWGDSTSKRQHFRKNEHGRPSARSAALESASGGSPVEILGDHADLEFRDTDVYGCQLHAPLLDIDLAI